MKKCFLFIAALFILTTAKAQWTRITAIHPQNIRAIALLGDTILTTSQSRFLYRSRDGGQSWDSLTVSNHAIDINCLKVIDEKNEIEFIEMISAIDIRLRVICIFLAILQLALEGIIEITVDDKDMTKFFIRRRTKNLDQIIL